MASLTAPIASNASPIPTNGAGRRGLDFGGAAEDGDGVGVIAAGARRGRNPHQRRIARRAAAAVAAVDAQRIEMERQRLASRRASNIKATARNRPGENLPMRRPRTPLFLPMSVSPMRSAR